MPYTNETENRIDDLITVWPDLEKKKMFGGVCYLVDSKMCFGVWQEYLIVRAGQEVATQRMREEGVLPFAATGKPMKGWVMVAPVGFTTDEQLLEWLTTGHDFAGSLPTR
jgi:TfoX/Sxy family transcriptional regulator of competence genes